MFCTRLEVGRQTPSSTFCQTRRRGLWSPIWHSEGRRCCLMCTQWMRLWPEPMARPRIGPCPTRPCLCRCTLRFPCLVSRMPASTLAMATSTLTSTALLMLAVSSATLLLSRVSMPLVLGGRLACGCSWVVSRSIHWHIHAHAHAHALAPLFSQSGVRNETYQVHIRFSGLEWETKKKTNRNHIVNGRGDAPRGCGHAWCMGKSQPK